MVNEILISNAGVLEKEYSWFLNVVDTRLKLYFGKETQYKDIYEITPPSPDESASHYADFVKFYKFGFEERIILLLALAPHIKPQVLDQFLAINNNIERKFTEFGGITGNSNTGFIPTGETALFILAGGELEKRFLLISLFDSDYVFAKHNILKLEPQNPNDTLLNGTLVLSREFVDLFTTGKVRKPNFSIDFPAKLIETKQDWEDLELTNYTMNQVKEILVWMQYKNDLMNKFGLNNKIKPGYRALFYGPPGTGKTLTASLLGKSTGKDVYRIDLSTVVSKYVGETSKNLEKIFSQAEYKEWILFFDEADALFGKRTAVSDAHDRYSNMEVSYLLQRVEDYDGVVILASNYHTNLDDAFIRRFQSVIHFTMPGKELRLKLWKKSLTNNLSVDDKVRLEEIADKYDLSGGSIINVVSYASLMSLKSGHEKIMMNDVDSGIKREFQKEGRTF
jgi:hypothetical protein